MDRIRLENHHNLQLQTQEWFLKQQSALKFSNQTKYNPQPKLNYHHLHNLYTRVQNPKQKNTRQIFRKNSFCCCLLFAVSLKNAVYGGADRRRYFFLSRDNQDFSNQQVAPFYSILFRFANYQQGNRNSVKPITAGPAVNLPSPPPMRDRTQHHLRNGEERRYNLP